MKTLLSLIAALALMLPVAPAQAEALSAAWDSQAYYITLRELSGGVLQPVGCRVVQMAAPLESTPDAKLPSSSGALIVRLLDPGGKLLFQTSARLPQVLRGEFQLEGEPSIESHTLALDEALFVVRVPVIEGARLAVLDQDKSSLLELDLKSLACADASPKVVYPVTPISVTGLPTNRLDLVILGDGYTAAEQSKFLNDATLLYNGFFTIQPLNVYKSYHNVYAVFTPSNESGADHPLYDPNCVAGTPTCCADSAMLSDPLNGQFKDTFYDSTYCYYNIHRLLVAMDGTAIYDAAASVPDWDAIMIIVNDNTYGGSGGWVAVLSTNSAAVEIGKHEYGHSFGQLADEYDYGYPSPCDDTDADLNNDCPKNVTNATTRAQVKWNYWFIDTTPIPTPENSTYAGLVGLFQGAYYDPVNYYRSGLECEMQMLNRPFCQVPEEILTLRLYQGGWGIPWEGISLIEPGTVSPPTATAVSMVGGGSQNFKATLLQPLVPIAVIWTVDGVTQGYTGSNFLYTPASPGTHTISLRVMDNGPYVNPLNPVMASNPLTFEESWTVDAAALFYFPMITLQSSSKIGEPQLRRAYLPAD